MWKLALLVFLVFNWDEVKAFDLGKVETGGFHTVSHHNPDYNFANFNPGANVDTDKGWTAGDYENSYSRMTDYARWTTPEWYRLSATLAVARIDVGADRVPFAPVVPAIVPSLRLFTEGRLSGTLQWIPRIKSTDSDVLHLAFEWSLGR